MSYIVEVLNFNLLYNIVCNDNLCTNIYIQTNVYSLYINTIISINTYMYIDKAT